MAVAVSAHEPAAPESPEQRTRQDARLLLKYHREGDLAARDSRFASCLSRASSRRATATPANPSRTSCRSPASGCSAIDRYDPDRGKGFARYAVPTMLGELKRHFRDKGWSVHVPRATQELALKVGEALGSLPARLGRARAPRDVAEEIGAPVEDVLEAMDAASVYEVASLDAPRHGSGDEGAWTYGDTLAEEEPGFERVEIGETLRGRLAALPARSG